MKKMLITGGAGFIGSHLAERLLAGPEPVEVVCVDNLSTGSLDNLAALRGRPGFEFVRADVRDASIMAALVERCDGIFHLAAAVGVQLIVEQPVHTIETNIHGSEVVLDLASRFGRSVLLASTSEVYGKSTRESFSEDDDVVFGPTRYSRWCYACSKMVDEFLALAHHQQFGLQVAICRFFNTIGPRQTGRYGMVVPRFVRAALRGEPITIYGTGRQSRCFCNVSDVVTAMVALIDCPGAAGEVVNVGAEQSIAIADLAATIIERTGSTSPVEYLSYAQAYGRPFDDMLHRRPDLRKIKRLIGYEPKKTLDQTLDEIIEYERKRL